MRKAIVIGGAGFIGSNLAEAILSQEPKTPILIYDNFSSGKEWNLEEIKSANVEVIRSDVKDMARLCSAMAGVDVVYHFASNPDIARAINDPEVDFWEGTYLTNNVLEAMRRNQVKKIIYASGSGIYGDAGSTELQEDYPLKLPISTYGASKLAGEAMICSYCHMFEMQAVSLRFANVVGPRQTHGVVYDFIKKMMRNPKELAILGDGGQSKSYIHVSDSISAMIMLEKDMPRGFSYYNVATLDYLTVTQIAEIVVGETGLKQPKYIYTGGDRGWKADVPVVRMNSEKIRRLGWSSKYNYTEAVCLSV